MSEEDIQDCFSSEDNQEALSCLKKVIANTEGDACRPKLVLLVQDGCVPCKKETALHQNDITSGIIKKINISSPEGANIIRQNDIDAVPALVLLDCSNNLIVPAVPIV